MTFPLPLEMLMGKPLMYLLFGLIGFAFGFILEISGFGNSKKLAAQFYFKEMTVLKVMFTAIVVAMVLLFLAISLGILDFNLVWVNPTYLWPGIVGGLIMGVGFIIGGFCPGTSLVSAATFKIDGVFFVLGGLTGIFLFGETVGLFWDWWNNSYYGRLTIPEWLNLPVSVVVLAVVLMALFMFWGSEQLERIVGKRDISREPSVRRLGAAALVLGALVVILIGMPGASEKWARIALSKEAALATREVQIHPGELLSVMADDRLIVNILDVRAESDYNLFHIEGAQRVSLEDLPSLSKEFLAHYSPNKVIVVVSNDEVSATQAWRVLQAESIPNAYILEGGVNNWLRTFAGDDPQITPTPTPPGEERLAFQFPAALGARFEASYPNPHQWELEFTPKIKLELRRDKSGGGCG
jgi:rhodanese-related sulfurtransferase